MSEHATRFTRGGLLKAGAAGAAGLYLTGGSALAARARPAATRGVEGITLTWLTWFDHWFKDQIQEVQKKIGIGARPSLAAADSEIYTKIRQTGSQFDITSADALWVTKMNKDGLTESFDINAIPAAKQLYSIARQIPFWKDGSNYMAYPLGWSSVQVYYNPKYVKTKPDSWHALIDPKYKGKIVYENQPENVVALGILATGGAKDPYNPTAAQLSRSKEFLKKLKPNILKLVSQNSETITALVDESAWIGLGNLGVDTRVKDAKGPLIKTATPKEGVFGWMDAEQMVTKSKHKDVFLKFMDATEQAPWIAKNFIANGRPLFNEQAYKILVNQGHKQRADLFFYNDPERALKMKLAGPSHNEQEILDTFNEVFGA